MELLQIYPTKKKKWQFIQELQKIENKIQNPLMIHKPFNEKIDPHPLSFFIQKEKQEVSSLNSRLGNLRHTNCNRFKKYALEKFKYNLTEDKDLPSELTQKHCPIKIDKNFNSVKINR